MPSVDRQPVPPRLVAREAVVVESLPPVGHSLLHAASVRRAPAAEVAEIRHAPVDLDPARGEVLRAERRDTRTDKAPALLVRMARTALGAARLASRNPPVVVARNLQVRPRNRPRDLRRGGRLADFASRGRIGLQVGEVPDPRVRQVGRLPDLDLPRPDLAFRRTPLQLKRLRLAPERVVAKDLAGRLVLRLLLRVRDERDHLAAAGRNGLNHGEARRRRRKKHQRNRREDDFYFHAEEYTNSSA